MPGAGRQGWGGGRAGRSGGPEPGPARGRPERRSPTRGSRSGDRLGAGLVGLASVAASARAPWACALGSGEEGAPLCFYGSTADHVENNNSLVRGQRQLVLLGAPSPAAGFPDRASPAPPRPPPCAPDRARACGVAERRPAPREGSAEGNGGAHPRLRERERRGAPRLGPNSAGPRGGPAARSSAAVSQEWSTGPQGQTASGGALACPLDAL